MSDNLMKRLQFGNEASRANRRPGTKSNFTQVKKTIQDKQSGFQPPSYSRIDQERGTVDSTAVEGEPSRKIEDKQVEREEKKDPSRSDLQHTQFRSEHKAATKQPFDEQVVLGTVYAKVWAYSSMRTIPRVTYHVPNRWIPSSIAMMQQITAMHDRLDGNEQLRWESPHYLSIAVTLYYSVLYYVQILRAQTASSTISKPNSTWLRAFFRMYNEESLVIAGPLVPTFQSIVAVHTMSNYNTWIVPSLPDNLAGKDKGAELKSFHDLIPNVPALFDLLQTYAAKANVTNNDFENGDFVKFPFATGGTLGGFTVTAPPGNSHWTYSTPGIDNSFPEASNIWINSHRSWTRRRIAHEPAIDDTTELKSIGQWLRMENDYSWFEDCLTMAVQHAKFFDDKKNMSMISTQGGPDVLIECEYRANRKNKDGEFEIPRPTKWYPGSFKNLAGRFFTREEDTSVEQHWNAMYTQILAHGPRGNPKHGLEQEYRPGHYWQNTEYQYDDEYFHPVNNNLGTLYLSEFYSSDAKF